MFKDCKKIFLCNPSLKPICVLNSVETESVSYSEHLRDYAQLTFTVDKDVVIDGKKYPANGYDMLDVYMYLYLEDIAYFQMQMPQETNDGTREYKTITAYSIDKEWEDKDWVGFKCNTGEKDSLEQLAENNLDPQGFAINFVKFYNPSREDLSLLDLCMEKMPGWKVGYVDPLLKDIKLSFSEDSINMYALMTSVIAPKAECVFVFDCLKRELNAYSKYAIDEDFETNIFIGFRNLATEIQIETDEDSIYTRFNVEGDGNLSVRNWNYDDSRILNLDYFLRDSSGYVEDETRQKIRTWLAWRDNNRENFAELSRKMADNNDKIYDLKYKLPSDGLETDQWENMDKKGLEESLHYYEMLLDSIRVMVDPNPTYTGSDGKTYHRNSFGDVVDSNGKVPPSNVTLTYNKWTKVVDGKTVVDDDRYLTKIDADENIGGYHTYKEVITYIIPNIKTAIANLNVAIKDDETKLNKDWEADWTLYGTIELQNKMEAYQERIDALKDYVNPPTSSSDQNYINCYNERKKLLGYIGNETTPNTIKYQLKKLNTQLSTLQTEQDNIINNRINMIRKSYLMQTVVADINGEKRVYETGLPNPDWGLTLEEIHVVNTLYHDTDYVNNNIFSTSLDTNAQKIDREKELYDDAVKKLSESSQPQFTYSLTSDNLMSIEEFAPLRDDCSLLRFIRLGIRDDYSVKMRIVGRSWNPCEITDDFSLEFSSMITSSSGRSDLTELLNSEGGSSGKNSISVGDGGARTDEEYAANLLATMISTGLFANAVGKVPSNKLNIDNGVINNIVSDYIRVNKIDVKDIVGDKASFTELFSTYIDAQKIVTDAFEAEDGVIKNLITESINGHTIKNSHVLAKALSDEAIQTALGINIYYCTKDDIGEKEALEGDLWYDTVKADDDTDEYVLHEFMNGEWVQIDFDKDVFRANSVTAQNIAVKDLAAIGATIGGFNISDTEIYSGTKTSVADPEKGVYMSSDGQFSVGDGDSFIAYYKTQDGDYKLKISGDVEIGSNGTIDDAFDKVEDKLANTIVDEIVLYGISTSDSVPPVYWTNKSPEWEPGKYVWQKQQFTYGNGTVKSSDPVCIQGAKGEDGQSALSVQITSSNGNIFKNYNITEGAKTILTCKVYYGLTDVTDKVKTFTWKKYDRFGELDESWNWEINSNTLPLTSNDVYDRARFTCDIEIDL